MKLYPEMFLSPWHLIVVVLALIAFIGLIKGGMTEGPCFAAQGCRRWFSILF